MPRTPSLDKFATKKELEKHKKEVHKMIKTATKGIKKWDIKQDKSLMKKKKRK